MTMCQTIPATQLPAGVPQHQGFSPEMVTRQTAGLDAAEERVSSGARPEFSTHHERLLANRAGGGYVHQEWCSTVVRGHGSPGAWLTPGADLWTDFQLFNARANLRRELPGCWSPESGQVSSMVSVLGRLFWTRIGGDRVSGRLRQMSLPQPGSGNTTFQPSHPNRGSRSDQKKQPAPDIVNMA